MVDSSKHIEKIFEQKRDFVIIATTGKVNSKVTDVCRLLMKEKLLPDHATQPADTSGCDMSEIREYKVIYRYLHHNWRPFIEISVTSIMLSFLLESNLDELRKLQIYGKHTIYDLLKEALRSGLENGVKIRLRKIEKILKGNEIDDSFRGELEWVCQEIMSTLESERAVERLKAFNDECIGNIEGNTEKSICLFYGILPEINTYLERTLKDSGVYTRLFQDYGNNIRAFGKAVYTENEKIDAKNIFAMPERVNRVLKLLRHYGKNSTASKKSNAVFVVINNFKNIFEAFYFRCRYSSFYLLSVACDESKRKEFFDTNTEYQLTDLKENLSLGKKVFRRFDRVIQQKVKSENKNIFESGLEYKEFKRKYEINISEAEFLFLKQIYTEKSHLRKKCYRNNLENIILQDVTTCIENADIFLKRDLNEKEYSCDYGLIRSLARIVALLMHPGLVTPTKIERCMQVAMTAKLNSGCLSRQVGAVVTDNQYNILSLGWNDTPCGAESCIRRNLYDLIRNHDKDAYSEYELYDEEFRKYLRKISKEIRSDEVKSSLKGLPYAFCFKDIHQDMIHERDQIYTRSLHAEERAIAMCGRERTRGGYLFTTSSPCELCTKKAKEGGIKKIYYIEQYPGISQTHILNIGKKQNWAEYVLFVGAIGSAYTKLYTPIMPYKDELKALGYSPVDSYKKSDKNRVGETKITDIKAEGGMITDDIFPAEEQELMELQQ